MHASRCEPYVGHKGRWNQHGGEAGRYNRAIETERVEGVKMIRGEREAEVRRLKMDRQRVGRGG